MSGIEGQKSELNIKVSTIAAERDRLNQIITTLSQEKLSLQA